MPSTTWPRRGLDVRSPHHSLVHSAVVALKDVIERAALCPPGTLLPDVEGVTLGRGELAVEMSPDVLLDAVPALIRLHRPCTYDSAAVNNYQRYQLAWASRAMLRQAKTFAFLTSRTPIWA